MQLSIEDVRCHRAGVLKSTAQYSHRTLRNRESGSGRETIPVLQLTLTDVCAKLVDLYEWPLHIYLDLCSTIYIT